MSFCLSRCCMFVFYSSLLFTRLLVLKQIKNYILVLSLATLRSWFSTCCSIFRPRSWRRLDVSYCGFQSRDWRLAWCVAMVRSHAHSTLSKQSRATDLPVYYPDACHWRVHCLTVFQHGPRCGHPLASTRTHGDVASILCQLCLASSWPSPCLKYLF